MNSRFAVPMVDRIRILLGRIDSVNLLILFSYALCAIVFTYPLIWHLTSHVPGAAEGDVPYYIWNLWWVKQAITTDANLFFTNHIFTPHGVSLAFHAFVLAKSAVSVPLQLFMTPWTAYNMLVLASFTLAAYFTNLLAYYLTHHRGAAWVAGIIYGFSPYMLARGTGHLNYLSAEWIPLYILCLLRLLAERRLHWGIAGAGCLLMTAYSEYYYLIYSAMFSGVYVTYRIWSNPSLLRDRELLSGVLLMVGLVVTGFLPILWLLMTEESGFLYAGLGGSAKLGADLLAFAVPPPGSWLYGDWGEDLYAVFSGGNDMEATVFAGYSVMALAMWGVWRLRSDSGMRLWVVFTAAFAVLALGPLLHIGGDFVFGAGPFRFAVPLPYLGLHFTPLLKGARVPARFDIMVQLGLALIIALSLAYLCRMPSLTKRTHWVCIVAALLVGLEYLRVPYPSFAVKIPDVYRQIAQDQRDVSILEVPVGWRTGWGSTGRNLDSQQLYQVIHGKKLVGGFVSRIPQQQLAMMVDLPGIAGLIAHQEEIELRVSPSEARRVIIRKQMIELIEHMPEVLKDLVLADTSVRRFLVGPESIERMAPPVADQVMSQLRDVAKLGYVVVHPPYSQHPPLLDYLKKSMQLEALVSQSEIKAYRVVNNR